MNPLRTQKHEWRHNSEVRFSARPSLYPAFSGKAVLHRYAGEHKRLAYGAVITFEGLTRNQEAQLLIEASGVVGDAILKAAGLRAMAKIAGATVLGVDLGAPIGDVGDIAKQKASGVWVLAFVSK